MKETPEDRLSFEDFAARRAQEQAWAFANGFNNGDPNGNGEFAAARLLVPQCAQVIDIGAHKGDFAKVAITANAATALTLVEPNPVLAAQLNENFPTARVLNLALSDAPGQGALLVHKDHPATASLAERSFMNPSFRAGMIPVETRIARIDDLTEFEPRDRTLYMKIDAEGFEAKILRGAERTLSEAPVAIAQFEHSHGWREAGESFKEAFYWLEQRGFDVRRITPYGLERIRFYTADLENVQYANYLALRGVALDGETPLHTPYGMTSIARFPA